MTFFGSIAQAGVISDAPTFATLFGRVLDFLLSVAGFVAILAIVLVAIRFLFTLGNVDRAATQKKAFFTILLGILVLFGALIIIRQISRWLLGA